MPLIDVVVDCPIYDSFRVQQVAGLFDVPIPEKAQATFSVEVPSEQEAWQIGLIVGPSGSGKSTIAQQVYGDRLITHYEWPADKAVIDCFGDLPIKQITGLLTSVGFSSPPSWIKPYQVLSGGEQFRCNLAKALSEQASMVAFDEFTSVVDRNVACIGSAAVAKAIRSGQAVKQFVAVTCHYDIAEWLEPDWIVDMATGTCQWRRLRRPAIELQVHRVHHSAWQLFARHHYLSRSLHHSARCYVAFWNKQPVAFCATLPIYGCKRHHRISRIVTLPDYQGIGIGMSFAEAVGDLYHAEGLRFNVTASHPALIAHCRKSPRWRTVTVLKTGSPTSRKLNATYHGSTGRAVVSFEYLGELPRQNAEQTKSRRAA